MIFSTTCASVRAEKTVFNKRILTIEKSLDLYNQLGDDNEIIRIQINKFNFYWQQAYTSNAFYKMWKNDNKLPEKISSINELKDFPILNKTIINDNYNLILPINKKFVFDKTHQLIKESKVVLGHESTVLTHAVLLRKPIIFINMFINKTF